MRLFGLVSGGLGLGFWLFRLVGALLLMDDPGYIVRGGMLFHLLGALSLLAVGLAVRDSSSKGHVQATEAAGMVASSVCYQLMGAYLEPQVLRPDLIAALALTYTMIARAVFVPSTARRTLLLTGAIGVPHVAILYIQGRVESLPVLPELFGPHLEQMRLYVAVEGAAWWTMTTLLAGATSHVLYGLRQEVRAAKQLGQYLLEEKLGEGGMGVVYRARHAMLRRRTAVKLLPPERAGEEALARFEREVQQTARLTHPNTVTIFDYGRTPEGVFYYAMELLDGANLLDVARVGGPLEPGRVVRILEQVAGSLSEAHGAGLIHRDLKPANIILCEQGGVPDVAKVVDFGLVKELSADGDVSLTHDAQLTGTPLYMSPESITDPARVDERSDLYSLGAVAYFLLAGQDVFGGRTLVEVCGHHLHTPPIALAERVPGRVPAELDALVLACLAKDPERRPHSARELRDRLAACAMIEPWTEAAAREWWEAHAEALEGTRQREPATTGLTIGIDLAGRAGNAARLLSHGATRARPSPPTSGVEE